jgi:rfaE bifunctional protein kinase chain/domain/rfaE bifunctional protein nucleotidyltransferase chain/domain
MEIAETADVGKAVASRSKILGLDLVADISSVLRKQNEVIVLCHGVFDLLHPGHIAHLAEAKKQGTKLFVSITPDRFVNKGPGRPLFGEFHRATMLSSLEVVDYVLVNDSPTSMNIIQLVKPHLYVKGPDYVDFSADSTGNISLEEDAVNSVGGRMYFTDAPTMSSSNLINLVNTESETPLAIWLSSFRLRHSENSVANSLHQVKSLKVLVVGEAIIDEYLRCEALGKSSKDPVLAFREISLERQVGGSLAIAAHCAGLGAKVTALFYTGTNQEDEDLIRNSVPKSVSLEFIKSETMPTITKRRYVDSLTESRVFETYAMYDEPTPQDDEQRLRERLQDLLLDTDLVVVADYGHGLLSDIVIADLSKSEALIAVNTQSNAGNRGYNTISRYPRVDFVCLNGNEMGLELRRRHTSLLELVPELRNKTRAKRAIVTEGARGLICCDEDGSLEQIPAFAQTVKDRVGAGDALFAATALLFATHTPVDVSGLFGNLAGAALVADLGNRTHLSSVDLMRHVSALLK